MTRGVLLFSIFALIAVEAGERAAPAEEEKQRKPLEHLLPVKSSSGNQAVDKLIKEKLCVTPGELARMISLPGWGPQSCLSVHAKTGGRERKFFISATIASENINYQMINGTSGLPPEKVTIQRADRTISEELALAIHQIWKRALLGTKEEESDRGDDGETTVFSAQIDAHTERRGRIWSPRGGMPKRFIELGKELEKFASDKDSDEKNMLEKVKAFERTFPEP